MKTLSVGEFKTTFSDVLQEVSRGEKIGVSFGRKGKLVAVLVPPESLEIVGGIRLGYLSGHAGFSVASNEKMTNEEFLMS